MLTHFSILPRTSPAGKVLTFRFQVNTYKTTWSLPWIDLGHWPFPASRLKLKYQLSWGLKLADFHTGICSIGLLVPRPLDSNWNYTIGSSGSPVCQLKIVRNQTQMETRLKISWADKSVQSYTQNLIWLTLQNKGNLTWATSC